MQNQFSNNHLDQASEKYPIWIIEDDIHLNNIIVRSLQNSGLECRQFFSAQQLLKYLDGLQGQHEDAILLMDFLLEDANALELLEAIRERDINYPFVIMTAYGDEKIAVELMKLGAMDYIIKEKHFVKQILRVIHQVSEKIETQNQLNRSNQELQDSTEKLRLLNKRINVQKLELENEKAKTDKLLQSVLPKKIARELLEKGYTQPREYETVSILFADVIGFSDLAKNSHPIELVTRLDNYFYVFDEIIEQYGLEKIKTIGDCYMCAGGIPEKNMSNPVISVLAGLKMQSTIKKLKSEFNSSLPEFKLRLGIHTGSVVAGVVGKNKFAYDIWGDAVNIASRIVEAGEEDKVNISEKTYRMVKDFFVFTKRGEVLTKRNYPIKMYFVDRLKEEFSADKWGVVPNHQLMKELDIKQSIRYY